MRAMMLWIGMVAAMAAQGQTLRPPAAVAPPALPEMDRLLSALLVLETALGENGGSVPAVREKKLVAGVTEHPALGWSGGERAKSAAILKKFRADFDGLRMKRTGQAEPTDEEVRDFYRARAALLEDTMQKLKKDLGGQAWSDVLGVTGKHLTEGKP